MHFQLRSLAVWLCVSLFPLVELNSHSSHSHGTLFLGRYPSPSNTPSPIDISSKEAKNLTLKPIYLQGVASDKLKLTNTGRSVIYVVDQPDTKSYLTGGPFYDGIYKFEKVHFYWVDDVNGVAATTIDGKDGTPIEKFAYFYNTKYGSFKNALNHRDGLAALSYRIKITDKYNPLFPPFGEKLKKIRKAGSSTSTTLGEAFKWYNYFLPTTTYYTYFGSYTNETTKQQFPCATIIIIPHTPAMYLSKKQFDETYGLLKNQAGGRLTNKSPQFPRLVTVVKSRQINQVIFPSDKEIGKVSPQNERETQSENQNEEQTNQNERQMEHYNEIQPQHKHEQKESECQNQKQLQHQHEQKESEYQNQEQLEHQHEQKESEYQNQEQLEHQHEHEHQQSEYQHEHGHQQSEYQHEHGHQQSEYQHEHGHQQSQHQHEHGHRQSAYQHNQEELEHQHQQQHEQEEHQKQ